MAGQYLCFLFSLANGHFPKLFVLDSGKTAMAATVGIDSDFPYVKIVSNPRTLTIIIRVVPPLAPLLSLSLSLSLLILNFTFRAW